MYVSDRIVSMVYIYKDILPLSNYSFNAGKLVSKQVEHIKERIADLRVFKEEAERNKII